MRRWIELEGRLEVVSGDARIEIVASGSNVRAEIGDIAADRSSLRQLALNFRRLQSLSRLLDDQPITLTVTRHGKRVVEFGSGKGGLLARLLDVSRMRLPDFR